MESGEFDTEHCGKYITQTKGEVSMADYVPYTRDQFEQNIGEAVVRLNLDMRDITDQARKAGKPLMERLYEVTTVNPAVRILIYSSVDLRTDKSRDVGGDAVRVQLWIKTSYGKGFRDYKTHYRTEGLFKNLSKTLKEAQEYVQDDSTIKRWCWGIRKREQERVAK